MSIRVAKLRTNHRVTPLGIDDTSPEFSWQLRTDNRDVLQNSYRIEVATTPSFGDDTIWNSGRVDSDLPFGARYAGPELASKRRDWWRV